MNQQNSQSYLHPIALCCCGIIAFIVTNLCHELIGHGLASLAQGNRITLLSSVYFRSSPHSFLTDAMGPVMNLIAGVIAFVLLKRIYTKNFYIRLTLLLIVAFNLFFFAWLCLYSGITNSGDLAFAISTSAHLLIWQAALIVIGLIIYYLSFLAVLQSAREIFAAHSNAYTQQFLNRLFLIPYLAGGCSALLAVSFFRPVIFNNFYEAFVFPMFLPLIFVPGFLKAQHSTENPTPNAWSGQWAIISVTLVVFVGFCLTMGRGIQF